MQYTVYVTFSPFFAHFCIQIFQHNCRHQNQGMGREGFVKDQYWGK